MTMMTTPPLFSRSQIQQMTGLEAQSLDYWSKTGILQPTSGGGGKGQHRKFDAFQVTIGRILFELQKLGVGGNAMKDLAGQFPSALSWFSTHDFIGFEEAVASLIEYRHDIDTQGYASVPDTPFLGELGELIPPKGSRRKLNWEQVVEYHRNHLKGIGPISDGLAEKCRTANFADYLKHRDRFFAISPTKRSTQYVKTMYLEPSNDGGVSVNFNEEPEQAFAYLTVNVALIKRKLWGWK